MQVNNEEPELLCDLENHYVYATLNAKNQLKAPTEFGICIRPTDSTPTSPETPCKEALARLICLACESERVRLCWITTMRLAKYGKQLRENYRSFKNRQIENMNTKEYSSFGVSHVSPSSPKQISLYILSKNGFKIPLTSILTEDSVWA